MPVNLMPRAIGPGHAHRLNGGSPIAPASHKAAGGAFPLSPLPAPDRQG